MNQTIQSVRRNDKERTKNRNRSEEEERINKPKKNNGRLMHNKCKWWRILFALRIFLLAKMHRQKHQRVMTPTHPHGCTAFFVLSFFVFVRDHVNVYQCINPYWNVNTKTSVCQKRKGKRRFYIQRVCLSMSTSSPLTCQHKYGLWSVSARMSNNCNVLSFFTIVMSCKTLFYSLFVEW